MLIILATIVLYVGFTYSATEWRINIRRRMNESDTDANTKAVDSLLNYETVKYFVAEEREARRYDRAMERYETASVEAYISLAVLNAGQATIFTIGLAFSMVLCAYGIQDGSHTVGDFVMINAMMIQLYQPLNFMGMVYREIKQAVIDIEMMFGILSRDPEIKDRPEAKPLAVTNGAIRFEGVSFAYEPERAILKDLSFEVPAGKTIAVVGPSGAGKSTISRLLFRFYDVTGGRILIDGQDIRDVTQTSLRAAIGMVPQDTVLFNDTIRYNIRYGRWDASDREVEEAARLAQIDGFIRLAPKGYETEVGERGLKLSGGEKQRVAIARTILKSPPLASSPWWVPRSAITPWSRTMISSAPTMVESRCAITNVVRSRDTRSSASWISFSVWLSSAEVASSSRRMGGPLRMVRAIATRCFSPPESFRPRSPTSVS